MILTEIELDESKFPQRLKDLIVEMIELDKKDDWLNYSFCAENLELLGKLDLQAKRISSYEYDRMCLKYCGVPVSD